MRRLLVLFVLGVLAPVSQVSAGPLTSASFAFQVGTLPGAAFVGAGATGTATASLSAGLNAGTAFNGEFTTTIPTTAAPPLTVVQVMITKNEGGTFTGTAPNNVGGSLAFAGVANLYGVGGYPEGRPPLVKVPLNIGSPSTVFVNQGGVQITAISAGWTAGTASVTGTGGTVTAMGANALTPNGGGTLVLVSPVKLLSNLCSSCPGPGWEPASFAFLELTYAPEPGTLLLVGLGVIGLGVLGRRRM